MVLLVHFKRGSVFYWPACGRTWDCGAQEQSGFASLFHLEVTDTTPGCVSSVSFVSAFKKGEQFYQACVWQEG